ncbi:hypothetical protein KI387_033399, partial [Taxus chinensis]
MDEFADLFSDLNLLDVDLHGNKYTWTNRRFGKYLIQVRLDRAMISSSWILNQDFHLSSLPRIGSDHNPIALNLLNWNKPIKSSFKFEKMWMEHDDIYAKIKEWWVWNGEGTAQFRLIQKLKNVKKQ